MLVALWRIPRIEATLHFWNKLSLFDSRDIAEITCPELYPGERLVVCRNPQLAAERARKRRNLLAATEKNLAAVAAATQRAKCRLKGEDKIRARIGKVINRHKMQKHFILEVSDDSFAWRRDDANIAAEAALDGFYILRTNLPKTALDTTETVAAYKGLSVVERAFRTMKTVALKVRPIHHRLAERVRAHLLICMLAYYVEHHMREGLAPMLFDDADGPQRDSIVAPPRPSLAARQKAAAKTTPDGMTVFFTQLSNPAQGSRHHRPQPRQAEKPRHTGLRHAHQTDRTAGENAQAA